MKITIFLLGVLFYFAATTFATNIPEIPTSLKGYTNFPPEKVKNTPALLNGFIALTPTFIIRAINERKIAPSSYSVIMRYAFRKDTTDGYEVVYYFRARDPAKNSTGKVYYGTFTAFIPTRTGLSRKLLSYAIDKALPRT